MPTPSLALPTPIEARIRGWIRIQEAQRLPKPKPPGPTITLSRQFGCEGFPLALALQQRLEAASGEPWTIYDKALVERVALDTGLAQSVLAGLGDATRFLEALGFHPRGPLTTDEAFQRIAGLMLRVAHQGRAILVGRGGAILCAGLPNAYHFRLVAALDWRVACQARRTGLPQAEAARMVKTLGRQRARFIQDALGADVEDSHHYDAIFNNEHHTVEAYARAITGYLSL